MVVILPVSVMAAPYAAFVMDARTGEVLHSRNADTRLHPASLTKMMTLYVVFQAVERGEISMDTKVKVSKKAAAEVPSKLGLRAGSSIKLRYLVRASAVKSANDAATAIAEAISGSEAGVCPSHEPHGQIAGHDPDDLQERPWFDREWPFVHGPRHVDPWAAPAV